MAAPVSAAPASCGSTLPDRLEFFRERLIPTNGAVAGNRILFMGASDLRRFDYAGIRAFAKSILLRQERLDGYPGRFKRRDGLVTL